MAIKENDNGDFRIDLYVRGRRVRRVIGPDLETAEMVVKDLQVKGAKEEHLGIVEERKIAFKNFCRDYLKWAQVNKTLSTYTRDKNTIDKHLIPWFGATNLPRIRIHDLRHSFGSNLVAAGVTLPVVSGLMGHKDISTTMIYAHLAPQQMQDAVDLLVSGGQDLDTPHFRAQKKSPA